MDNFRRFVVVFSILIFCALTVSGFFLALHYNAVADGLTENISVEGGKVEINNNSEEKTVLCENVLFAIGNLDEDETDLLFILNINTSNNTMSFLMIPKDLEYSVYSEENGGRIEKISAVCHRESVERCAEVLSSVLDISIPYYIHMDSEAFITFVNVFTYNGDGFYFEIPADFSYTDNGSNITFKKGRMKFNGTDAYKFIRFYKTDDNTYKNELLDYYDGTDIARLKMFKRFISEFINSQFIMQKDDFYSKNFENLFGGNVIKLCNTNINTENLALVRDYLSLLQKNSIYYFIIDGEVNYNGEYYIQYTDILENLSAEEEFGKIQSENVLPVYFKSYN